MSAKICKLFVILVVIAIPTRSLAASQLTCALMDHWQSLLIRAEDLLDFVVNAPPKVVREPSFIDEYQDGVKAYLSNDWPLCVDTLERSLSNYHAYYNGIAECRVECEFRRAQMKPMQIVDVEHLHFFEGIIQKTLCMEKCKKRVLPRVPSYFYMDNWAKNVFRLRKPYEYLQLCYYHTNEMDKAASATYTVLTIKPDDKVMVQNIQYYASKIDNFSVSILEDHEAKPFNKFYLEGLKAYETEDWPKVIESMETSLETFIKDYDKCRAFCEGNFDQGWFPEFVSSIANHFTYCLRCKRNCTVELSFINGQLQTDVFASHYEYLQMAYFNTGNVQDASRATSSYLHLVPGSEDMIANLQFYENQPNTNQSFFDVRQDAAHYFRIEEYEKQLLKFIDKEFVMLSDKFN